MRYQLSLSAIWRAVGGNGLSGAQLRKVRHHGWKPFIRSSFKFGTIEIDGLELPEAPISSLLMHRALDEAIAF